MARRDGTIAARRSAPEGYRGSAPIRRSGRGGRAPRPLCANPAPGRQDARARARGRQRRRPSVGAPSASTAVSRTGSGVSPCAAYGSMPTTLCTLFRQPTEEPAVSRPDLDHARSRRERAERTENSSVPEAPQRLEQQVDGSGRRGVGAAPVQARRIVSGATDRHRRAARTAAVETVERRRRPAVGTANREPGLHRGTTAGDTGRTRRHQYAPP